MNKEQARKGSRENEATSPAALRALADRCEREEPNFTLESNIFQAIGGPAWDAAYRRVQEPCGCPHDVAMREALRYAPNYTTSLDAAVTLVPEGLSWYVGKTRLSCMSNIYIPDSTTEVARADVPSPERPAMALCAAALRAKAAVAEDAGLPRAEGEAVP